MAVDVNEYAKSLMTAAGITDPEQQKQYEPLFSNDKVKAQLNEVLTGVERERGRVAAATEQVKAKEREAQAYYQEQLALAARNKAVVDEATAAVNRYKELYGELPGGGDPNNPAAVRAAVADVVDKKTFDSRFAQVEGNTVGLAKSVMKITAKHMREFPELELDPDAIVKIAQEQNLPAEKAWEVFTAPARQAKEAARIENEKKAAVDAALMEVNTRQAVSAVVDSAPRSEFITNLKNQQQPDSALEGFKKGWNDPNAAQTMAKEFGGR